MYSNLSLGNDDQDEGPASQVISEEIRFTFLESVGRWLWTGAFASAILAGMVSGGLSILYLAFLIGSVISGGIVLRPGEPPVDFAAHGAMLPIAILAMFAFAWCFVGTVAFPIGLWMAVRGRSRQVTLKAGGVSVSFGNKVYSAPVVRWTIARKRFVIDSLGCYLPTRQRMVLHIDEQSFACGFTNESYAAWESAITGNQIALRKTPKFGMYARNTFVGVVIGMTLGSIAGWILQWITQHRNSAASGAFLGATDGLAIAILLTWATHGDRESLRKRVPFVTCVLTFTVLAAQACALSGIEGIAVGAILNTLIGSFAWLTVASRMKQTQEREDLDSRLSSLP
jgi:hypothetical protein